MVIGTYYAQIIVMSNQDQVVVTKHQDYDFLLLLFVIHFVPVALK